MMLRENASLEHAAVHGPLVDRFLERLAGSWMTQALYAAAELGIADHLAAGPRTCEELAAAANAHAPSLHRLLRALATLDICKERPDGLFEIAPMGRLLEADHPASLRSWTIWWGHYLWPIWGNLVHSVKTGESSRKLLSGTEGFEHLERDPDAASVFGRVTVELTRLTARFVVPAYDFSGFKRIVDVGGGHGELLAPILQANPGASGILFDLPYAVEGARRHFEKTHPDLAGRCEFVAGDFFRSVPGGADACLLKNVLHDWDDERSRRILEACRRAMAEKGRLLVVEQILPERREASPAHQALSRHDLTMMVACGARERTEIEYRNLLESGGFRIARIFSAGPVFSVIEALPV